MDINILVVNVGNSRTALGAFIAGDLKRTARVENGHDTELRQAIALLASMMPSGWKPEVVAAGVSPVNQEKLDVAVREGLQAKVQWIGSDVDLPMPVVTDEPAKTGVDRVLNVAAAYEQFGHACAVADLGTATTVSFADDKGQFVGGIILPGARLMLEAMHEKTALLPELRFEAPKANYGRNTVQAMLSGVSWAIRGAVRQSVEAFAEEVGHWPELIATGGDAEAVLGPELGGLVHQISPDLTLWGIANAYTEHLLRKQGP